MPERTCKSGIHKEVDKLDMLTNGKLKQELNGKSIPYNVLFWPMHL